MYSDNGNGSGKQVVKFSAETGRVELTEGQRIEVFELFAQQRALLLEWREGHITDYITRGWNPVPLPFKGKNPDGLPGSVNWHKRRIDEEKRAKYFPEKDRRNVGIQMGEASNYLADVDHDCREALRISDYFLPKTGAIFGHTSDPPQPHSKPKSHYLYHTDLDETLGTKGKAAEQFLDPNLKEHGTLLELRYGGNDKGAQTMAPGSVHPSGERVEWAAGFNGVPGSVKGLDLLKPCKHLATASLLGRYWPEQGQRHEAALRLGGFLARCGFSCEAAENFAEAVAVAALAPEGIEGNRREARDAFNAHAEKKNVYGYPALKDMFGEKTAEACARWLSYPFSPTDRGVSGGDSNYRMLSTGLFWKPQDSDDSSPMFLCGPFEILAESRDVYGYSWGLLAQWKDHDGHVKKWAMPKTLLKGDGVEVRGMLLDGGLDIASGKKARELLTNYLGNQRVPSRVRAVSTTGWHDGNYVFPDWSIGESGEQCFLQLETEHAIDHKFRQSGTLAEWQDNIAKPALGNSNMIFLISCAPAGALLSICNREGMGFHEYGPSSLGKSTGTSAAGSFWGGDPSVRYGFSETWRATANGLEGVAATHNDALLCLDEMGQISANEAGQTVYMLANGHGKRRAGRSGAARKSAKWREIIISNGELRLGDKMAEDFHKKRVTAGQQVRLVELPADTGIHGFFEDIHGAENSRVFADQIMAATRQYYGTAAPAFIQKIIEAGFSSVKLTVDNVEKAFIAEYCPKGASFQAQRVTSHIGFAAASGELAIAFGIFPWPRGTAIAAAATRLKAWLKEHGETGSFEDTEAIRVMRDFIDQYGSSRFLNAWDVDECMNTRISNQIGYRKAIYEVIDGETELVGWEYYLTGAGWREVLRGLDSKRAAQLFVKRGYLTGTERHPAKDERIPGAKHARYYCLTPAFFEEND